MNFSLTHPIQPKSTIGQSNNQYEQQADAMADQVMRMPQAPPLMQRKCEDCEEEQLQMKPLSETRGKMIQKEGGEDEKEHPYKLKVPELNGGLSSFQQRLDWGDTSLKLDHSMSFEMEMERIRQMLSINNLKRQIATMGFANTFMSLPMAPLKPNLTGFPLPTSQPTPKPQKKVKPRNGDAGDVLKAIVTIPAVGAKLEEVKEDAIDFAVSRYNNIHPLGQGLLIQGGILLLGGAVAKLVDMPPEDRMELLDSIDGTTIPIAKTPFSITYSIWDPKKILPDLPDDAPKAEQIMIGVDVVKLMEWFK